MSFINIASEDYSDIIDKPRYKPSRKSRIPMSKRAALFKSFVPFSGYVESVEEVKGKLKAKGELYYDSEEE